MLKENFKDWLNKQTNISKQTKKDYFHRLEKICYEFDKSDNSNVNDTWGYFATHIFEFIEKYQNNEADRSNDVSAMKKFNEFLYEGQYACNSEYVKDIKPIMKALSWFPGSETEAPQIRTSCNNGEDDLLTPTQVARFLGVSTKTLREWRKKNIHLPFLDLPQDVRYTRQSVNSLLQRRFREVLIKK